MTLTSTDPVSYCNYLKPNISIFMKRTAVDRDYVDPRFQTMACVNFQNPSRTMVAASLPPLCVRASIYVKGKNM